MKITIKPVIFSVLILLVGYGVYTIYGKNMVCEAGKNCTVSAQTVNNAIKSNEKIKIVDVRTPEEYQTGFILNGILLPLDQLESKAMNVLTDKNETVYVYCRTGRRSAKAIGILNNLGYKNVYSVDGGINMWRSAGFDIYK